MPGIAPRFHLHLVCDTAIYSTIRSKKFVLKDHRIREPGVESVSEHFSGGTSATENRERHDTCLQDFGGCVGHKAFRNNKSHHCMDATRNKMFVPPCGLRS